MPCGIVEVTVMCSSRTGWEKGPNISFLTEVMSQKGWEVSLPLAVLLTEEKEAETMILNLECVGNLCLRLKISSFAIPVC